MKCPKCNCDIGLFADAGRKGGSAKSDAKTKASRLNGRLGGRPKKIEVEPVDQMQGSNES